MGAHTTVSNRVLRSKVFHVNCYKGEAGLFIATSPDLEGLLVAEISIEALEAAVPQAIVDLYRACGEEIIVDRLDGPDEDDTGTWVGIPAEVAARQLVQFAGRNQ